MQWVAEFLRGNGQDFFSLHEMFVVFSEVFFRYENHGKQKPANHTDG